MLALPALAQGTAGRYPHRVITSDEIRKAGDQPFQHVLHYLLPEVFPKTDQAWLRTINTLSLYVDNEKLEPEYINAIRTSNVRRILIWEKPWESAPMILPDLARTRYVVSIETTSLRDPGSL